MEEQVVSLREMGDRTVTTPLTNVDWLVTLGVEIDVNVIVAALDHGRIAGERALKFVPVLNLFRSRP